MTLLAGASAGVLAISFSAIFVKLAGVSPATAAFFRVAYALPLLAVLAWGLRRRDRRPLRARLLATAAGVAFAADLLAWHASIEDIGAGLSTLLANTQVLFVGLAAWVLFGERPNRVSLLTIPVVFAGVAMVSGLGDPSAFGARPVRGAVLGVLAGVFYTIFLLAFRAANRTLAPAPGPLLDATAGATVTALVLGTLGGGVDFQWLWPAHGWLLVLALAGQVFGWMMIGYALPRLPALTTSFFLLVQPAATLLWGALIFSERVSPVQGIGAALVLGGVAVVTRSGPLVRPAAA